MMEAIVSAYLMFAGLVVVALLSQEQLTSDSSDTSSLYRKQWGADSINEKETKKNDRSNADIMASGLSILFAGIILAFFISDMALNQSGEEATNQLFQNPETAAFYAFALFLAGVGTRGWKPQGFSALMYMIAVFQVGAFLWVAAESGENASYGAVLPVLVAVCAILAKFRLDPQKTDQN